MRTVSHNARNLGKYGFDESTREFIRKIKSRPKPPEPKEWHKELKSYEGGNSMFYERTK